MLTNSYWIKLPDYGPGCRRVVWVRSIHSRVGSSLQKAAELMIELCSFHFAISHFPCTGLRVRITTTISIIRPASTRRVNICAQNIDSASPPMWNECPASVEDTQAAGPQMQGFCPISIIVRKFRNEIRFCLFLLPRSEAGTACQQNCP